MGLGLATRGDESHTPIVLYKERTARRFGHPRSLVFFACSVSLIEYRVQFFIYIRGCRA